MAFGTGTHATTKLCIRALERRIKGKGVTVLDVGTGSGILAIASAKLGVVEVWGVDVDGVAVKDARENVKRKRRFRDRQDQKGEDRGCFEEVRRGGGEYRQKKPEEDERSSLQASQQPGFPGPFRDIGRRRGRNPPALHGDRTIRMGKDGTRGRVGRPHL